MAKEWTIRRDWRLCMSSAGGWPSACSPISSCSRCCAVERGGLARAAAARPRDAVVGRRALAAAARLRGGGTRPPRASRAHGARRAPGVADDQPAGLAPAASRGRGRRHRSGRDRAALRHAPRRPRRGGHGAGHGRASRAGALCVAAPVDGRELGHQDLDLLARWASSRRGAQPPRSPGAQRGRLARRDPRARDGAGGGRRRHLPPLARGGGDGPRVRRFGLAGPDLVEVELAALLHDIGKLHMPAEVLTSRALTPRSAS